MGAASSIVAARPGVVQALTADQQREVARLRQRDQHVRQHEAAHQAAGGGFAGGASFGFARGPDGRSYAVSGEVPISMPVSDDPATTIAAMARVRAAALAPADPSGQDMAVAAQADAIAAAARARLQQLQRQGDAPYGASMSILGSGYQPGDLFSATA